VLVQISLAAGDPVPVFDPIGVAERETRVITDITYDPSFPKGTFTFTPPPGATLETGGPSEPPTSLVVGEPVPAWTLRLVDGGQVDLASFGHDPGKPVALYFWATWCVPCVGTSLEAVDAGAREFSSGECACDLLTVPVVLAVAYQDDPPAVRDLVQQEGYSVPVLEDLDGTAAESWGVSAIPTLVLIDSGGRLAGAYLGVTADQVTEILHAFADERPLPSFGGSTAEQLP
jgi:thiol-disulfide isomerase/thioredoxin